MPAIGSFAKAYPKATAPRSLPSRNTGAPAHSLEHTRVFDSRTNELCEDCTLLGIWKAGKHSEDLNLKGLRLRSRKDGVASCAHAGFHLLERIKLGGCRLFSRLFSRRLRLRALLGGSLGNGEQQ